MANVSVHFEGIKSEIRNQLSKAQKSIKIAVAWFNDEDIIQDLVSIKKNYSYISIQVIISNDESNFKQLTIFRLNQLAKSGADLRIFVSNTTFLHHKFCLIDRHTIINGSSNWTYRGFESNEENITVMKIEPGDQFLDSFHSKFDSYIQRRECVAFNPTTIALKKVEAQRVFEAYDEEQMVLRKAFQKKIQETLKEVERINPTKPEGMRIDVPGIRKSIDKYGDSVNLVKKLLHDEYRSGVPKTGLYKLGHWKRLDISFEMLALSDHFKQLFTEDDLRICQNQIERVRKETA